MKNIKIGDKIVYDWHKTKHYVLVKTIDKVKFRSGKTWTMINEKFMIDAPFRKPTPLELEVAEFK